MTSSDWLLTPLLACVALVVAPLTPAPTLYEAVEPHMGTLFRIKLYVANEVAAKEAFRAAFTRIDELDKILSDYQPDSELSRITRKAVRYPARVSEDLFRVAETANELSEDTRGAFDLTIGPLTHLWRQARRQHSLPGLQDVEAARKKCGYASLHLDAANRTMEFDRPEMLLDAGGIAKGYAADQALAILSQLGVRSALVAASGDLAFSDAPPGQAGWKIGIDSFNRADKPFTQVLALSNAAVSTSGNSEQQLISGGKSYSHIIDPETGMGLEDDLTVTAISRRGVIADSAATAISVMGCTRGLVYANRQNGLAVLIVVKKHGNVTSLASKSFSTLVFDHLFR